jgi:hypothetical protein
MDLGDGFPVNRASIAYNAGREEDWYGGSTYTFATDNPDEAVSMEDMMKELDLQDGWPSKAMLEAGANRLDNLERPILGGCPLNIELAMKENLPQALEKAVSGEATPREAAEWLAAELSVALQE